MHRQKYSKCLGHQIPMCLSLAPLPSNAISGTVLLAIVVQLVTSNMLALGLTIVQEVPLTLQNTVGALIPLITTGVSFLISLTGLFGGHSVINFLISS